MREAMSTRATATVHGWLLLLPAMALLVAFTHWPAVATFIDSFYSTPRPRRPERFVGLDNYRQIVDDPVFWQSLINNFGTHSAPSRCPSRWRS
jgi:sn-glycerol 3-phosphate transport system permease protein